MATVQRDSQSAQHELTDKTKEEASKTTRIASVKKSITKHTSASILQSTMREVERLQNDVMRIQNARADAQKREANKTERLHTLQQDLFNAQQREQESALKKLQTQQDDNAALQRRELARVTSDWQNSEAADNSSVKHDVFISHTSEDTDDMVRPLAKLLREKGVDVRYDEFQLSIGDSLRRSMDRGLAKSRFGIVVCSSAFFGSKSGTGTLPYWRFLSVMAIHRSQSRHCSNFWYKRGWRGTR